MRLSGLRGAVLLLVGLLGSLVSPAMSVVSTTARLAGRDQIDAVVEGTVEIPRGRALAPLPRYPNQTVQPVQPEPRKAVVYLDGTFPAGPVPRSTRMGQKGLQFVPGLLPVRRGTSVIFPNDDDLYHNVFSYSKAKRFDLGRYRKDETPAVQTFERAGVVRLSCEIHSHMEGVILVLDTPHFQKTDANGAYRLEGLPAGKFTLKAWISEKQVLERPVELVPGARLRVDFVAR